MTGSFNDAGSPVIKISVFGAFEQAKREFEAIVDTGFTGFVSMPIVEAFPLGLILLGTTTTLLADGNITFKLTALGRVTFGDRTESGVILLGPGQKDLLVGMEFLKVFDKSLVLAGGGLLLFDNEEIRQAIAQAKRPSLGPARKK
jgi:predicted aspartyl protease